MGIFATKDLVKPVVGLEGLDCIEEKRLKGVGE